MRNRFFTILVLIALPLTLSGQQTQRDESKIEQLIQELLQQEESIDFEDAYESLLLYYNNPLDLNQATSENLLQLYLLSPLQIEQMLAYRKKYGAFISLYELQNIPGFDLNTIQKLLPFVTIRLTTNLKTEVNKLFSETNHYVVVRYGRSLEKDTISSHNGDENKYYLRYRNSKPGQFSYGITMEKDAGETILWDPAKRYFGSDFTSGHFSIFNKGILKAFTAGDYQLQFGQGLVVSSGFRLGKGSETILSAKQNSGGARPYSSSTEFGYYRGSALTITSRGVDFTLFYSNKNIDASRKDDDTFTPVYTGYHRTKSEISKRNSIHEQVMGTNISFNAKTKNLHCGFTFVKTIYNYPLRKTPTVYNAYEFSGSQNHTMGMDLTYTIRNFILFGESAISRSNGKGMVGGFLVNLSKQMEASMVVRNYQKNFHSFYANSFGESSQNINEKGIYWGIKYKLSPQWILSCYYDQFNFPWLRYQADAPSRGQEYLGRITFQPSRASQVFAQFKTENKEKNSKLNTGHLDVLSEAVKTNFLFHAEIKANPNFTIRSRVQFSTYEQSDQKSTGYAMMTETDYTFHPFAISLRYTLFDTDDYDNRQYMYEKDLLYTFSIPAYYGKGTRAYAILKCKIQKNTDVWIKYSRTTSYKQEMIHTEEAELPPAKSDFRIQLRYSFQ